MCDGKDIQGEKKIDDVEKAARILADALVDLLEGWNDPMSPAKRNKLWAIGYDALSAAVVLAPQLLRVP